jgi:hypothetical protein
MTDRAMKAVLWNFLGTFTSRHSDFQGHWLFGFLIEDLTELQVDLMDPPAANPDLPLGAAIHAAVERFEDQRRKAGLDKDRIREARLTIRKLPVPVEGSLDTRGRASHKAAFIATAVMVSGKRYERERFASVAPHDPRRESRSTRADGAVNQGSGR